MKTAMKFVAILMILGLALVAMPAVKVSAATICVNTDGSGGCLTDIQAAISAATTGDTITVAAGTYNVSSTIVIDKAVTISGPGSGGAIVQGTTTTFVSIFEITSNNVTLENLDITHNALRTKDSSPLPWTELANSLVRIPTGVGLTGIVISNNNIYVPLQTGAMSTWNGVAITVGALTASNINITGNTIFNTRNGVVIYYNNSATITNNNIYHTKGGIMNYTGSQADADARAMTNNTWGTVHNEWDMVWNSGGGPYTMDMDKSVLQVSKANNDAYVLSLMSPLTPPITGNRSHVFVNVATGTTTPHGANGNINLPYKTLALGIDAVVPGGKVLVAGGTYPEQVNITKRLSLIGAGMDGDTPTIISANTLGTVLLSATGTETSPILLKDIQITGPYGIRTNTTPIDYVTWDHVWLNANPVKAGEGFRINYNHQMTHLTIKDSIIEGYIDGVIIEKYFAAPCNPDLGTKLQYVTVTDTIFRNNYRKGMYTETLSDATFTNVQLIDNGYVNPGTNLAEYNSAGFDLNLKNGTYANLNFINMTATRNGLKAKDGAALMIKARDDGASYSVCPATLDNVLISGGSFTDNERGIRFGEPGKTNAGPTNVSIDKAQVYGNVQTYIGTDGSAYGDVVNFAAAKADVSPIWWGAASGPATGQMYGSMGYVPWCLTSACDTFFTPPVHNVTQDTYFSLLTPAVAAAHAGDSITMAAGTYVEPGQIVIDKNLTITGADKLTTIIKPAVDTGNSSDARGFILVNSGVTFNLSGVTIDGAGRLVNIGILSHGPVTIEGNIFKNIGYNPSGPDYAGRGIAIYGANSTIRNNSFSNIGRIGIYAYGTGVSAGVVNGNTYVGKGDGNWLDYGIEIEGGAKVEAFDNSISNCSGRATVDGSSSSGLLITTYWAGGSTANVHNNTFSNNYIAIADGYNDADTSVVTAQYNKFIGNDYGIVSWGPTVAASPNWWNNINGPLVGDKTYGPVNFVKWCGDAACSFLMPGDDNVVTLGPGTINVPYGIDINTPHLTILLKDGTIIQNDSPCFNVNASYTTITTESIGGAKCIPTDDANGIDVAADLVNITINGIEFVGTNGTDGFHFAGALTDTVLVDNWFHNFAGDGIEFVSTPTGTVQIEGNLFQNNTGLGIRAPGAVKAEYNSWGKVAGATAGVDASPSVDTDPWTHVELKLASSGTPVADQVVNQKEITYTISADLQQITGAEFTLNYDPAKLQFKSATTTDLFDPAIGTSVLDTDTPGKIKYAGSKYPAVSGESQVLYTVTFKALTTGTAELAFDSATDVFAMIPLVAGIPSGPSTNVYAYAMDSATVTLLEPLAVTVIGLAESLNQTDWTPVYGNLTAGYTMAIDTANEFEYLDVTTLLANRPLADGSYPFYLSQSGLPANFFPYWAGLGVTSGTPGWDIIHGDAPIFNLVVSENGTEFALMDGMFPAQLARVSGNYPLGTYTFNGSVSDTVGGTDSATINLTYVAAPTLNSTDIEGYYLTGDLQEFNVLLSNIDGMAYSNALIYYRIKNAARSEIATFEYEEITDPGTWYPMPLEVDGSDLIGTFGPAGGSPLLVGIDGTYKFRITFNTAKDYEFEFWLQDLTADNRLADFTGTAIVYTKPVISSTTLAGPYQTGNDQDFSLNITNPSGIPAPFDLHFNFPAGTVLVYGGTPYPCDGSGCTVPVSLPAVSNDLTFTVTFAAPFIGNITVDLFDSDWTPDDRLLATLTQSVISLPNFTVTGTISMQGRTARRGAPVKFTGSPFGPYTAISIEQISNNLVWTNVAEGTYLITTNQPRYLNVTSALNITVAISASKTTILPLELKGGNAYYADNVINTGDASLVGGQYGGTGSTLDGDVNFDGRVNIQDLAIVGGNFYLTSAGAYGSWVP